MQTSLQSYRVGVQNAIQSTNLNEGAWASTREKAQEWQKPFILVLLRTAHTSNARIRLGRAS